MPDIRSQKSVDRTQDNQSGIRNDICPLTTVHCLLLKRHSHAGRFFAVGETIFVEPHDAEWLIAHGIAVLEVRDQGLEVREASNPQALNPKRKASKLEVRDQGLETPPLTSNL